MDNPQNIEHLEANIVTLLRELKRDVDSWLESFEKGKFKTTCGIEDDRTAEYLSPGEFELNRFIIRVKKP